MMNTLFRNRGFTLLELMIAITVVAIISTLAVPSFNNFVRNNRMTTQANDLLAMAYLARSEAVKRRDNVALELSAHTSGWSANIIDDGGDGELIRVLDNAGTSVVLGCNPTCTVTFNAFGRASSNTIFTLQHDPCAGQQRREVVIELTGRAAVGDEGTRACQS